MGYLEEKLINESNELLFEAYPPVILGLTSERKQDLANLVYIGPDSKQKLITKEEAIKVPYSNALLILTDEEYEPFVAVLGSKLIPLTYESQRRIKRDKWNRKKVLEIAKRVFYISSDVKTAKTFEDRERKALPSGTLGPGDRKLRRETPHIYTKKDLEFKSKKEALQKLVYKYKTKKKEIFLRKEKNIASVLKKIQKDWLDEIYSKSETNDELQYIFESAPTDLRTINSILENLKDLFDLNEIQDYKVNDDFITELTNDFNKKFKRLKDLTDEEFEI